MQTQAEKEVKEVLKSTCGLPVSHFPHFIEEIFMMWGHRITGRPVGRISGSKGV